MTEPGASKVLVVGIDGVRWDTLHAARTPHLDRIGGFGFGMSVQVHPAGPTISGPCWTTMATGTLASVHGVIDNESRPSALPSDFLADARAAGLRTYAAASWSALLAESECGPLFAAADRMVVTANPGHSLEAWNEADQAVADDAGAVLAEGDFAAAFLYFGLADEVAHALGVGADYVAAIEASDRRLGEVLGAIEAFASSSPWTVIAATDHGHVDAGGHGGDTPAERTAWVIACGPSVPDHAPAHLEQADVYAQVLTTLGLPTPSGRFARPFGARR